MGKILALDLGEQWIGSAISDTSLLIARPFKTVMRNDLENFIRTVTQQEDVKKIIIGYPKTMRGTVSQQTQKVIDIHQELSKIFPEIQFILWDERLSSKRADSLSKNRTKEDKIHAHSVAAAFILDSYLGFLAHQKSLEEINT